MDFKNMHLSDKQSSVLRGMLIGATTTVAVTSLSMVFGPQLLSDDTSFGGRIAFALKADLVIVLWLGISIARLARHRFFTPEDIDGGGLTQGTENAKVLQATLQNTLEQTVLAVLTHLIWVVTMPVAWVSAIPAALTLFLIGRVLFARGYTGGAPSRALGFALSFYPSMLMLMIIVFRVIQTGIFYR
jgi:hypothetical protein